MPLPSIIIKCINILGFEIGFTLKLLKFYFKWHFPILTDFDLNFHEISLNRHENNPKSHKPYYTRNDFIISLMCINRQRRVFTWKQIFKWQNRGTHYLHCANSINLLCTLHNIYLNIFTRSYLEHAHFIFRLNHSLYNNCVWCAGVISNVCMCMWR